MEALWDLEDKWKISTQEAVLLFACTALLVVGLCAITAIKRKARRKQLVSQDPGIAELEGAKWPEPRVACGSVKKALMSSVRWSSANGSRKERMVPLLVERECRAEVGWQSHNSASPVWQRPILMGEKCELPRFSGLILYDERGRPLHQPGEVAAQQENAAAAMKATLRDLL